MPAPVDVNDPTQPLPAAWVAKRLGVSRQLFAWWVRTQRLTPADRGRDGRPLYRLMDAAHVEAQARRSGKSHRGRRARPAMDPEPARG